METRDQVFAKQDSPRKFAFNEEVAAVFDDMVERSVPYYHEVLAQISDYSEEYFQEGSVVYDVGCSTGTLMEILAQRLPRGSQLVGIDSSASMVAKAVEKLEWLQDRQHLTIKNCDCTTFDFEPASVVVLNYVLQFIPVSQRRDLLKRIYAALRPSGILILSDKVASSDKRMFNSFTRIYENFKRGNGYSQLEVERKKQALEDVLVPFSFEEEMALLKGVGFEVAEPFFKWQNFMAVLAIK